MQAHSRSLSLVHCMILCDVCDRDRCLCIYEWNRNIEKRSQFNEPKLNVCFHNDQLTRKNERREQERDSECAYLYAMSEFFAAVVHQICESSIVSANMKHMLTRTHTGTERQTDTLSHRRRFQCSLPFFLSSIHSISIYYAVMKRNH